MTAALEMIEPQNKRKMVRAFVDTGTPYHLETCQRNSKAIFIWREIKITYPRGKFKAVQD